MAANGESSKTRGGVNKRRVKNTVPGAYLVGEAMSCASYLYRGLDRRDEREWEEKKKRDGDQSLGSISNIPV